MTNLNVLPPEALQSLKDQMVIVMMKRCMNEDGVLTLPISEVDATGQDYLIMECNQEKKEFVLTIGKKS